MRSSWFVFSLIALLALPAAFSAHRWSTAKSDLAAAESQHGQTMLAINRINSLRSQQQQVESHEKPQQAIIAQVNAVLVTIGVDQTALGGVTPLADEPYILGNTVGSSPYRTQSVQVSLRELSGRDAARFLLRWRQEHSIWQPMQIQLTHGPGRDENSDRFNLTLTLRAIYLADGTLSTGT